MSEESLREEIRRLKQENEKLFEQLVQARVELKLALKSEQGLKATLSDIRDQQTGYLDI